jgi:hypothetical protein
VSRLVWIAALAAPLLVIAAELLARWWIRYRKQYYVFPPGMRLRLHIDEETFPQLERTTRFDVNADGERGSEVPPQPRLFRILVAGGSQPEGYLLDQETTWPGGLQRLLRTHACLQRLGASAVHVGSIARSGVGAEALDLLFERVLPRYPRLQLIIVLIGATDMLRWLEYGAPKATPPVGTSDVFRCHPEGPFGWKPTDLALLELVLRARRRWLRPVTVHERAGRWVGRARAMRAQATTILTEMPDPEPMLERFDFHFRRALRTAKAHADRVMVVRQPWFDKEYTPEEAAHMWHGGAGQAWREQIRTYYSFPVTSKLMSLVDARAAAVAEAMAVEQVDLMRVLEPSLVTYYDCFHLTPAGAGAVATAIGTAVVHGAAVPAIDKPVAAALAAERNVSCVASPVS